MAIMTLQEWLAANPTAITSMGYIKNYNDYVAQAKAATPLAPTLATTPAPTAPAPTSTTPAPSSFSDLIFGAGTSGSTPPYNPDFGPHPPTASTTSLPPGYDPKVYAPVTAPPGGWSGDPMYDSLWYSKQAGATIPAKPAYTAPVGGTSFADLIGTPAKPAVNPPGSTTPPPPTTPPPSTGGYTPPPPATPWTQPALGSGSLQPVSQMNAAPYLNMLQPAMRPATSRGVPTSNIYGAQLNAKNPSGYQTYLNTFDAIMNAPRQMPNYAFTPAPTAAQTAATSAAAKAGTTPSGGISDNGMPFQLYG